MNNRMSHQNIREAWVVFSGQTDMNWLKIFKPGFRHCYLVINDGRNWMTIDPLSSHMEISVNHVPVEFNLPLWLKDRGHKIVKAEISREKKEAPWMLFTCVEAVKRVLGIHKRWIITPWQLHRHLMKAQIQRTFQSSQPAQPAQFTQAQQQGELAWEV